MRLLVFSDSHGNVSRMRQAMLDHPEADIVVHLGDCERDMQAIREEFPDKKYVQVCGNCDFVPSFPMRELIKADNALVYCTHGHGEEVKFGTEILADRAHYSGSSVALYGHTHVQMCEYFDGIYLFNPGSIRSGEYGMVDITPTGIMCLPVRED